MFKPRFDICIDCKKPELIIVKKGLCKFCNERIKKEKKSQRVVKLFQKVEKRSSYKQIKARLWDVFSEYIRLRDSNGGVFICISCHIPQQTANGNLHAGHYYKSETYPALRYEEINTNGQCERCNIFKEGNRQGYEIGMIKKYGKKAVDDLKLRCHNKAHLGRFELELLTKIYSKKLADLKLVKGIF